MKTVLFIDKGSEEIWDSYLRYDFILAEYEKAGDFHVCDWNPSALTVRDAIPELKEIVGDEEEWQAVIACDLGAPELAARDDPHFDNPYDFPDNYEVDPHAPLRESSHPLVRLTQMLGGLPEKAAAEWPDWRDYGVEDLGLSEDAGEIVEAAQDDPTPPTFLDEVLEAAAIESEINVNEIRMDIPVAKDRYDMMERYRLEVARPETIVCIAPRIVDEDVYRQRRLEIERQRQQQEDRVRHLIEKANAGQITPSERRELQPEVELGFWQRNDYPASARFFVCDRRPSAHDDEEGPSEARDLDVTLADDDGVLSVREHADLAEESQRDKWFQYWLCALSLLTSCVPYDYMRPYGLMSIEVDVDEGKLTSLFSERVGQWTAVRDLINAQIDMEKGLLRTSEYEMREIPDTTTTIDVPFDLVNESSLHCDPEAVRLFKDDPESDDRVWKREETTVFDGLRTLLRAPKRGLSLAASRFRESDSLSPSELEYCLLNEYQTSELKDEVEETELRLASQVRPASFELETYKGELEGKSREVYGEIETRATKTQALGAIAIACLALLIGFLPYCLGVMGGLASNGAAWIVTAVCIAVLDVAGYLMLRRMRREVRDSYRSFNGVVSRMLSNVHDEGVRLGRRVSDYATCKKRWQILERQARPQDPTERMMRLGERDALIRTRIQDVSRLAPGTEADVDSYRDTARGGWPKAETLLEQESFYSICDPVKKEGRINEGKATEMSVQTPYSFMDNIDVDELELC